MNKKYKLMVWLLMAFLSAYAQTDSMIRTIRTTAYEAVRKDTAWVKGKAIDNVYFVKYDSKGRMSVENLLKPDGSPKGKIVYRYDPAGRVEREIYATADAGGILYIWNYGYDTKGRLSSITTLNGQRDTLGIVTAIYAADGKVEKKLVDDRRRGDFHRKETGDTTQMKRESSFYMQRWKVPEDQKEVLTKLDEFGNWIQKTTYKPDEDVPEYITERDISYDGTESDLGKIPLRGTVKKVSQYSYLALPKGQETVLRGEKKGHFFVYEFDTKGRKIREEIFTGTGTPTENILYEYNDEGDLQEEVRRTVTGTLIENIKYAYDKEGLCRSGSVYDEKGELTSKIVYRHDLEGNRIQETVYGKSGAILKDFRYVYDSYGQQIERKIVKQPEGATDAYPYRRSWNFQKRMTGEEVLLPGGGSNLYTYKYNKKGEVISGTEQLEGQPTVKYIYKFHNDENGNWKIRLKYVNEIPILYEERKFVYYE